MKYSWGLLQDQEIGQRLFKNGMRKTYKLLVDVFDLDVNEDEIIQNQRVISCLKDPDTYQFEVVFMLSKRIIAIKYALDPVQEDIVQEVLKISEKVNTKFPLNEFHNSYKEAMAYAMTILETNYGLVFTPLDPDETDSNIKEIQDDLQSTWQVVFTQDDFESTFKAVYDYVEGDPSQSSLTITEDKLHFIYLD